MTTLRAILRDIALAVLPKRLVAMLRPPSRVFGKAYATGAWGSEESGSGGGSELAATTHIREYLPKLFARLGVNKVLDAPCGDWNWMRRVDLSGIDYVGADVVSAVVQANRSKYTRPGVHFVEADIRRDTLPKANLILCRDCWVHLSFEDIANSLENFRRSGAEWLLVNDSPDIQANCDQLTGWQWRRLNLQLPPFNFPPPLEHRPDNYPTGELSGGESIYPFRIALWRIADLPKIAV